MQELTHYLPGPYKTEEIFCSGSACPLKIGQAFTPEKGKAFGLPISGPTLLLIKGVATSNPKLLFHENNISFIYKRNTDIQRNSSRIGLLGLCP